MQRRTWIFLFSFLGAAHAHAQASLPLELTWQAPAECPPAEAVRTELERIAHARQGLALEPLRARAVVNRHGTAYKTTLHTDHAGSQGQRRLEARDCATLLRSVTLVLALTFGPGVELTDASERGSAAVDSGLGSRTEPRASTPEAAGSTDRSAAASSATSPGREELPPGGTEDARPPESGSSPAAAPRRIAPVWSYLLGIGARLGLPSAASVSVSLGAEVDLRSLSLGARATAAFAPKREVEPDIDARFESYALALAACGKLPLSVLTGSLCGAVHAGLVSGSSSGATQGSSRAPWYAVSSALGLSWPRGAWVQLRAEAGIAVSLDRPRFVIDGLGQVERIARVVPDFGLLVVFVPRFYSRQATSAVSTTTSSK